MTAPRFLVVVAVFFLLPGLQSFAQEVKTLVDFETPADLNIFEFRNHSAALSDQHATHGAHSLKIAANEYLTTFRLPHDWSGYDALELDIFVEGDAPVSGSLLIADAIWDKSDRSYWNRHNAAFNLSPGVNTLSIPVNGLYRGESGSRGNDIKSNIDPKQITRFDIGFSAKGASSAALYLDHLRLTKESRPAGILAFDLGPASQTVAPGFTAIAPGTVYGKGGNTAGMDHAGPDGQAQDDTFPTRLYRDYINMDGFAFITDVPEKSAKYRGWVMYDDLGYWGGETAAYRKRAIIANSDQAFAEERGPTGPTDYLFALEKIEPHPGDRLWDLYMQRLFQPRRFGCASEEGKIRLRFTADAGRSCNVAAIILYPETIAGEAEKWVAQVEARNRAEFESRAIFLGPKPEKLAIPSDAQPKGYWLGYPGLETDVSFADAPGAPIAPAGRSAAKGERVSFTFAVRPLQDFAGAVRLTAGDLKSNSSATIPAKEIDLRYVQHAAHRNFNDLAYSIGPDTLRLVAGADLSLTKDLTRQFWITVHVPETAAPGSYSAPIVLTAGNLEITVPLNLTVLPYALDEPDFAMGFYGVELPRGIYEARGDAAWLELLVTLREAGMNSFSGGPNIPFKGLDATGQPILDFARVDHFMKLCRTAGYTRELNGYGGPGLITGLHESHAIGETGRAWEKKTGKPFGEILRLAWSAVRDHAQANNWLPVAVSIIDEPRVLDQARENDILLKLYREQAPWVNVGGSYSVAWDKTEPFDLAVQDLFKNAKWSGLNLHTQTDLDKAKEFGSEIQIYNQAITRYSFGAYQWAEMHKGAKSRMQWHTLALHGYQFFDLDGREPDTAMINWTSQGLVPNIALHRCREGADDLRYAVTLWNLAQKQKTNRIAQEAITWLEQVSQHIPLDARTRPAGFMDDEAFRTKCVEMIGKIHAAP